MNRSREELIATVNRFDVERNYLPQEVPATHQKFTHCNAFASDIAAALGCPVPLVLANDQHLWLTKHGAENGWASCSSITAQEAANKGCPSLATWVNSTGHGHIALVVPSPKGEAGVWIAQAGAANFSCGHLSRGFGALPVSFWRHL